MLIAGWDNTKKAYKVLDPMMPRFGGVPPSLNTPFIPIAWNAGESPGDGTYEKFEAKIKGVVELRPSVGGSFNRSFLFGDDPSPIEILMIGPDGRRTGLDPETGVLFEENDVASYWTLGPWRSPLAQAPTGASPRYITFPGAPSGTYHFKVMGTANGPLQLVAQTWAGGPPTVIREFTGTIAAGEVRKYDLQFSSTGASTVEEVETFAPHAQAGNDVKGVTDTPVQFDANLSTDYDGSIVSYEWDFGDGTRASGAQVSHSYTTPGTYTAQLTITDDFGATATDTVQASIALKQLKPVAVPSGPYIGFPEYDIGVGGYKSFDPNGDLLTYRWDFGDSAPVISSPYYWASHRYAAPGTYTVTLVVNDGIEDSEPATTTVEILPSVGNLPTAGDSPPEENLADFVKVSPSCGPPGTEINVEMGPFLLFYAWDYSNGPIPSVPSNFSSVFYMDDGMFRLTFANGPRVWIPATPHLSSNYVYSFKLNWTIPSNWRAGTHEIMTYGGEGPGIPFFTIPCPEPENHIPVADAGGPAYSGKAGVPIVFDGSGSYDPDDDPLTYYWDFGDGHSGTGVDPQHTYAVEGSYLVTLIVNDGQQNSQTFMDADSFAKVTVVKSEALACDINLDGRVDRNDILLINGAKGQQAAPGDARDYNQDGWISGTDSRACTLKCTYRNCASTAP